jgi:hypothetical protein
MSDRQALIDRDELAALIEKAMHDGSRQALREIGLGDENAMRDLSELRNLLDTWRQFKRTVRKTVWQTATRWGVRLLIIALIYAVGWHRAGPGPFWLKVIGSD